MTFADHEETSPEGKQAKVDAQAADTGAAEVQAQVDKETEQGYRGIKADPTPDEHYSVDGVTSGKPTPETDKDQARKVRDHLEGAPL